MPVYRLILASRLPRPDTDVPTLQIDELVVQDDRELAEGDEIQLDESWWSLTNEVDDHIFACRPVLPVFFVFPQSPQPAGLYPADLRTLRDTLDSFGAEAHALRDAIDLLLSGGDDRVRLGESSIRQMLIVLNRMRVDGVYTPDSDLDILRIECQRALDGGLPHTLRRQWPR